ncbi:MAG: hypothetical protein ACPGU1_04300 [Myxococcota bacterium]
MNARLHHATLFAIALSLSACYMGDPIPVECVCQCGDEAPAAAAVTAPATEAPAVTKKAALRDAVRAKRIAAKKSAAANGIAPVAKRVADATRRAGSRVARQPGTGDLIKTDPRTQAAMVSTYSDFLKGAEKRQLAPIKPYMTTRLHGSLEKNLPKYEDRFFNGLRESVAALGKGALAIKETRDMGRGNVEALVVFANGHERRVIFLEEGGGWKLNRL